MDGCKRLIWCAPGGELPLTDLVVSEWENGELIDRVCPHGYADDSMVIARCESLVTGVGEDDAIARCRAYLDAGADGILIHSKTETPAEVLSFAKRFRAEVSSDKPLVVMPTTYPQITEEELAAVGINIVIYANHLLRAAYPAMHKCAERILECERVQEASEELCCANLVSGL